MTQVCVPEFTNNSLFFLSWKQGNFVAGKYKCLLCQKEFVSESGVKYHINSVHAEVRSLLSHHVFVILWNAYICPTTGGFCAFLWARTVKESNSEVVTRDGLKILCKIRCIIIFFCESIWAHCKCEHPWTLLILLKIQLNQALGHQAECTPLEFLYSHLYPSLFSSCLWATYF